MISLKNVPLFKGLSESELTQIGRCLKEKTFEKGEMLFNEGKPCERVFVVREGRIKLYRISSAGREQILETLESGDTCACNPGYQAWCCTATAEAVTSCKVWFMTREDYYKMVQSSAKISQTLNSLFAERLRTFSSLIEEVSLKDVKKRLAKFLLDMLDERERKYGKGNALFIPFTREEIAQRIGAVRETVVRYLMQFKKAKLIDIKPHQITILDKEGLKKILA